MNAADDRRPPPLGGRPGGKPDGGGKRGGGAGPVSGGRPSGGGRQRDTERPFRPERVRQPPRPRLPEERPHLPRDVHRDLRAASPPAALDDVMRAYGSASDALLEGDLARAAELLAWAKQVAPRSAVVREAHGVVHYSRGEYAAAQSELLTYRRLSGRQDQNHLLADCARAAGRPDKVSEYVEEMIAGGVGQDRVVEGLIVLAGDRADRGDMHGALETLGRATLDPTSIEAWHPRLWYVAADVCERMGDEDRARDFFEAILAVDEGFEDVADRLAALDRG